MKKIIVAFLLSVMPVLALAAGGGMHNDKVDIDLDNKASLQNGAKLFVNYCLSCHSAKAMRYNRMAVDLGMTDKQVFDNLIFTADYSKKPEGERTKVGSTMEVAMRSRMPSSGLVPRSRIFPWWLAPVAPIGFIPICVPSILMSPVLMV